MFPGKIRFDLEMVQDGLGQPVGLRRGKKYIAAAGIGNIRKQGGVSRTNFIHISPVGSFLSQLVVLILGYRIDDLTRHLPFWGNGKDGFEISVKKWFFKNISFVCFMKAIGEHFTFYPPFAGKDSFLDGNHRASTSFSKSYLPKMKQQTQREFTVSLIIYQKNPYINLLLV